jgi:hypothetical protein
MEVVQMALKKKRRCPNVAFNQEKKSNTNECRCQSCRKHPIFYIVIVYPRHFDRIIDDTVQNGNQAGCFRMKFDYRHPVLMISQVSLDSITFPAGGDQSLFITKNYLKNSKDLMRISSFETMKLFLGFIKNSL